MMKELIFDIKGRLFNKTKRLIINESFISFGNNIIPKDEITAYRYGVHWIQLDITFGREYVIYVKSEKKDLKISFKTYFGRNNTKSHKLYATIVDELWNYYFCHIIRNYLNRYDNEETFTLKTLTFSPRGITIKRPLQKQDFISWENVRTKNYQTYFAVHSAEDPTNIHTAFSYLEDWNVSVLYSVLRGILQHKEIEVYN